MLLRDKSTQIKEQPSWEAAINIKIFFFDSFILVYIRLDSSTTVQWLVYTRLHLSTLVCIFWTDLP